MENIVKYIMIVFIGVSSWSCSEKFDIYNSDVDRLGFYYGTTYNNQEITDSVQQKTFAFYPSTVVTETVWLEVHTMGYVYDHDRILELEQVDISGVKNAVSGVHYVAFNDPEVSKHYVIPAGQIKAKIPVILKREASLKNEQVTLKIKIKTNENFDIGYPEKRVSIIEFADILLKPKGWNFQVEHHFGGDYSFEKFSFMVQVAKWVLNDEWFEAHFPLDGTKVEMGYAAFTSGYFQKALKDENKRRRAAGMDVLKEKVGEGERPIQFTKYGVDQPYEYNN